MTTKTILYSVAGVSVAGGTLGGGYCLFKQQTSESPKKEETDVNPTESSPKGNKLPKQNKTIQQLFQDESVILLNTGEGDTDKDNWNKLIEKFLESSTNQDEKITAEIKIREGTNNHEEENIEALKNACKLLLSKEENSENFEKNKTLATNWCTNNSKFLQISR